MKHSEQINEIAAALAKAQGVMGGASKDSSNPFYKSKYADLESVWSACRKQLSENGLAVVQTVGWADGRAVIDTMLTHTSGQWIAESLTLQPKDDSPQGIGSCITYGRRYALAAIVGVYQTDDDGEAAHGRSGDVTHRALGPNQEEVKLLAKRFDEACKAGIDGAVYEIHLEANGDQDLYRAAWGMLSSSTRTGLKAMIARAKGAEEAALAKQAS
jgi:hypothetical protein